MGVFEWHLQRMELGSSTRGNITGLYSPLKWFISAVMSGCELVLHAVDKYYVDNVLYLYVQVCFHKAPRRR